MICKAKIEYKYFFFHITSLFGEEFKKSNFLEVRQIYIPSLYNSLNDMIYLLQKYSYPLYDTFFVKGYCVKDDYETFRIVKYFTVNEAQPSRSKIIDKMTHFFKD